MPANYNYSKPNITQDEKDGSITVNHNHVDTINFNNYRDEKKLLNQVIDEQKVALAGCMAFFKAVTEDKKIDGMLRAAAVSALAEDEARYKNFDGHKSRCVIL